MINLIYIHGLHSSPRSDKLAILEQFSDRLYAPFLDYENDVSIFPNLLDACKSQEINFIVGSSAGGLMGYWLAKHLGCSSLLFNPALNSRVLRPDIFPPQRQSKRINYFCNVVLGAKDTQVLPQNTKDYLEANESQEHYLLDWQAELEHTIDIDTFRFACEKYLPKPHNV